MQALLDHAPAALCALFLALALGAMAAEWLRPVQALGLAAAACVAAGMVPAEDAVAKLTHPAVVTVALIVALTATLAQGPALVRGIARLGGAGRFAQLRLLAAVGAASAVVSNTAIVASVIRAHALQASLVPANLLLPLSYAAIAGGTMTLVGTSTNLVVSGLWRDADGAGLQLLDLLPVGALCLLACLPVLWWLSRRLPAQQRPGAGATSGVWCLEAGVEPGSALVGKTVEEAGLRQIGTHYLVRIIRSGRSIEPVAPSEILLGGDLVQFVGDVGDPGPLVAVGGLRLQGEGGKEFSGDSNLCHAVVPRSSPLADHSLKDVRFRTQFDAAAVAIARGGERLQGGLGDIRIEPGDALVLLVRKGSRTLLERGGWVRILSEMDTDQAPGGLRLRLVWAFAGAVLVAAAFGWIGLFPGFLALAAAALATRVLRLQQLYNALPLELAATLASGLVLSEAIQATGVDALAASAMLALVPDSPWAVLAAVFFFAVAMTEIVTNAAAAAVVLPVALEVARLLGVDPMPFVLVVAYGASGSFLTPHGYQTNLMVQAVTGYSWGFISRAGLPVLAAYSAAAILGTGLWFGFSAP